MTITGDHGSGPPVASPDDAGSAVLPPVTEAPGAAVELRGISKTYGDKHALHEVDLTIRQGELVTLLGPSGSGKSTLLRIVAGLERPTTGQVLIGGQDVSMRDPEHRDIGVVFQHLALFPHLDVAGNIGFPLKMRRMGRRQIAAEVERALEVVRLPGVGDRMVHQLSGGQRQRIAIARALVYRPSLLLLDEPLSSLDRRLREEMQLEILRLHQELDVTIVNVTHDQKEALVVSDRIAVMREARLMQLGTAQEIYRAPQHGFVADFVGDSVRVEGTLVGDVLALSGGARLDVQALREEHALPDGSAASLVLRAEHVRVTTEEGDGFPGVVRLAVYEGDRFTYEVDTPALGRVRAAVPAGRHDTAIPVGSAVHVSWHPRDAILLGADA